SPPLGDPRLEVCQTVGECTARRLPVSPKGKIPHSRNFGDFVQTLWGYNDCTALSAMVKIQQKKDGGLVRKFQELLA
ncbi:MAG: hypothetical protein KA401_04175, partial [Anaerolineae bacterium]|nr:hypothetical protein [Anaerolineae bacterium]